MLPASIPRQLLNSLRRLMAEGGTVKERLDRVVRLIATTMVADVCSIYLRTEDDYHLLAATEGLLPEAVFRTRLALDEGLIGLIALTAEPLALQDAPRHPAFSYRPETGEDPYFSFLGVPMVRAGRVIGVLAVQNRSRRRYDDAEVESLQTIAMVLAEVVGAAETLGGSVAERLAVANRASKTLKGRVLCAGLGLGTARLHDPVVPPARFFSDDTENELGRLARALSALRREVDALLTLEGGLVGADPREVMETYRLLAHDEAWAARIADGVRAGLSAEASVDRARREHRARINRVSDPLLKERLHDFEDLDNRLLRTLARGGDPRSEPLHAHRPNTILVARRLGPAALLEYREAGLRGLVLEEAALSSHAAIVARAMSLPALGGIAGLTVGVAEGDDVIVDAVSGEVHIRPEEALVHSFETRLSVRSRKQAGYRAERGRPIQTRDGVPVELMMNAGLSLDMDHLDETGASGIGLFRTEFQFLVSDQLPRTDEQELFYRDVLDKAGARPVVFRTLDLGGDKPLASDGRDREENPALGWRSLRFALDQKGLFRRQLRALLRAAEGRPLNVMFPMVTVAQEFKQARAMLEDELQWGWERGRRGPSELRVGAMLETPALAFALEELKGEADFLSIGTNDLMQFFFAADRTNAAISDRYSLVSRPALRFVRQIVADADRLGIPVSACGEAGGDPLGALALLACGVRKLSMPASGIGPVRSMIFATELEEITSAFTEFLRAPGTPVRDTLSKIAAESGLDLAADMLV